MSGHGDKQRLQDGLIAALLVSPSIEAAAKTAGVAKSTALRWLTQPQFRRDYDAARQQALDGALQYLRQTIVGCVAVLYNIALNPSASDMARIAASGRLIDFALRGVELQECVQRLQRLEEHFLQKGTP
jgi:hypothetical protein